MNIDVRFEEHFLFTQHSLNTFEKCPLKFKKRYIENLKWESLPQENIKRYLDMGRDFHLLAYRYFSGIDDGSEELYNDNPELQIWINSLVRNFKIHEGIRYLPEYKLRMNSNNLKLEANFDLIMVLENEIQIWDWKTHSGSERKKKIPENVYRDSLQTIVYLFVLKEQIKIITGKEIAADKIVMRYWQPGRMASSGEKRNDQPGCMASSGEKRNDQPGCMASSGEKCNDQPGRMASSEVQCGILAEIKYSDQMHEMFRNILVDKVQGVLGYAYEAFDKTEYLKHCKYCEFNWFCNNESIDYDAIEEDVDVLSDFDWDSIEEKY